MKILHWNDSKDGPLSEKTLRQKLENLGYQTTRYTYPPGTYFPNHTHDVDKIDGVLSGQFKMTIKNQSVVLKAGDCLEVPRGTIHSAEVVGEESVISLDAIKLN